jgi:Beta-1,3-glucanase
MLRLRFIFPMLILVAGLAAGCGGGGADPSVPAAPTPTPGVTATPTALPLYCSNYSSNSAAGAIPLNITDDSGLGAVLIVYIQNGKWMDTSGSFNSTTPYPLPAACFSTTLGSSAQSKPLNIPQGASGRIYLAYATPDPSGSPPNPFNGLNSAPNVDFADSPYPWDFLEYTAIPGSGVIDTSQVDAVGLPLELSLTSGALPHQTAGSCSASPSSVVGVTECGFSSIFTQMNAVPQYNQLVITQNFNGKLINMRVVSPQSSFSFTSFQWNLFDLSAYAPTTSPCTAGNTGTNGYLQCVLASYQSTPRIFTSKVPGASGSGDWYCATSDGTANFIFTDVGATQPASCVGATPSPTHQLSANPFQLPITTLTYGIPPAKDTGNHAACQYNVLFGQPYGLAYVDNQQISATVNTGTGNLFSGTDAFAMWKAIVADLNYGTSLSSLNHPVGQFVPLQMSSFWQDPMYNTYSKIVHANFDRTYAYSLAYDDLYGWSTSLTLQSGNAINVRINHVDTASTTSAAPVPVPLPTSCSTITPEIGTY